ncbi:ribose-5-phosphate isomerase RpiA [Candidatus Phycosocius spiralis]|uniref:Ribose-5-phosphate isomerase A n=1 Tax=Candidatus Phycosocius spiralis TaxID=2815099 RepID=A0ABQ4PYC7_9PROT|nr:ribose-5-phosphate isomerase RpiA [Candidatus Phycosocius spiralis]GIU68085.1 ribose-5-phosphate isomerase A [Candidatus Phycosocius spiralis]
MNPLDLGKIQAAAAAIDYLEDGMIVGLGTGSTTNHFIAMLGDLVAKGFKIGAIPTSQASARLAESLGIALIDINQAERIDVTVDGADEVDQFHNLLKGGGGALLREKIVAHATDHMVVIADRSKRVTDLGAFPLPVEVTSFGFTITAKKIFDVLRETGCSDADVKLREAGAPGRPFVTDNGNFILDCSCGHIPDAATTAQALNAIPGVVENGIFLSFPHTRRTIIFGDEDGVEVMGGVVGV